MLTRTPSDPSAALRPKVRDPRLDVFRGLAMFIILIAHIPMNPWADWIPARFGFSDATEMFVFLSGMASAIAFGRLFDKEGFLVGTARVAHRVWQVYWAHVLVFVTILAMMVAAGSRPGGEVYPQTLNLMPFLRDPGPLLVSFLTLTYVPNYFDILPMYLVILALMPLMLALERVHRAAPFVAMAALWGLAQAGLLDLPAEPWSDRPWYFEPFGWQLLFFLGFFFRRGTLKAPGPDRRLFALAGAIAIVTVPFAWYLVHRHSPFFADAAYAIRPLTDKSHFGLLRLIHFLALAYIAVHAVGEGGRRLVGLPGIGIVMKVGQQTLAVFIAGMVTAQAIGIVLDHAGRTPLTLAVGNLSGFAILIAVAFVVAWFKAPPWKAG